MTKLRVYIATTQGPSEIQGIIEEDSELQSVICLDGTATALPISPKYDAFVRKPTGVVERVTGNRVYRMDVSHPVTNGNSWQLGAYLAHVLDHNNELAHKGDMDADVILATGALRTRDLHVDKVGHVAEKLDAAIDLISANKVVFILPAVDFNDLSADVIAKYSDKVRFIPLENAEDIAGLLSGGDGGASPQTTAKAPVILPLKTERSAGKKGIIILLVLGAVIIGAGGYLFSQWQMGLGLQKELARMTRNGYYADMIEFKEHSAFEGLAGEVAGYFFPIRKAGDVLSYEISQVSPSDGKPCAGMRFRDAEHKSLLVTPTGENQYDLNNIDSLCAFEIKMHNNSTQDLEILSLVKPSMIAGRFLSRDEGGEVESYSLPAKASRSIEVMLPLYRNKMLEYDVWLIGSAQRSRQLYDMLRSEARADNSLPFNWDNLRQVGVNIIEAHVSVNR